MKSKTRFYYVADSKKNAEVLSEVGCKNVLTSYFFTKKIGDIKDFKKKLGFEKVMVDSGAFSAFTLGEEINLEEYVRYLLQNEDYIDTAIILDVIGNEKETIENYKYMVKKGVKNLMCVLQGNLWSSLRSFLKAGMPKDQYIGIGNAEWYKKRGFDQERDMMNIASRYKVHGLAKGSYDHFKSSKFESIDSSSWGAATRYRSGSYWWKGQRHSINYGKSGVDDRQNIRYMYRMLKKYFEPCEVLEEDLVEGKYQALEKSEILGYYKPQFKHLGMYEQNFKF